MSYIKSWESATECQNAQNRQLFTLSRPERMHSAHAMIIVTFWVQKRKNQVARVRVCARGAASPFSFGLRLEIPHTAYSMRWENLTPAELSPLFTFTTYVYLLERNYQMHKKLLASALDRYHKSFNIPGRALFWLTARAICVRIILYNIVCMYIQRLLRCV